MGEKPLVGAGNRTLNLPTHIRWPGDDLPCDSNRIFLIDTVFPWTGSHWLLEVRLGAVANQQLCPRPEFIQSVYA